MTGRRTQLLVTLGVLAGAEVVCLGNIDDARYQPFAWAWAGVLAVFLALQWLRPS